MPDERALAVVCDGSRLAGGLFLPEGDPRALVVLLHGIPSVAPASPDDPGYRGAARVFAERGWAAAWADMRAVRGSQGFFSIEGWVRDARAIVDAARAIDGLGALKVGLVGSSAGGAVAAEVVRRGAPVDAVALLAPPAAWFFFAADPEGGRRRIVEEAGMSLSPEALADLAGWAAEFEGVTTEEAVGHLRVPLLIVHGTEDDVVPVAHAHRIADRARGAELRIVEGAPHVLRRHPGVLEGVAEWLEARLA